MGEKDAFGNPIKITGAVYTSEQGVAFIVDADNDGLPTYILDPTGNKIVFTNYTDSTVEISIYNSNNELSEGPTTIPVNPSDLTTLKQLYSSVDSKNKDVVDVIVVSVLKWGGFSLNWAACVVAVCSSVVPAILNTCGSALLSTLAMFTQNDADNIILSTIGVLKCNDAYYKPWKIMSCVGSIMSFISQIVGSINQSNEEVVLNIDATAITYYQSKSGEISHKIYIGWSAYNEASGYRVYRSVGGESEYVLVFDSKYSDYNSYGWHDYSWDDLDVGEGNSFFYYVTAYGNYWETTPSEKVSIKTFLPPCSLISPEDGTVILDSNNSFTWSPVGLSNFYAYDPITSGKTEIWVYNKVNDKTVWQIWLDGLTISNVVYNQDGNASPLVPGDSYIWSSWSWGYDEYGYSIAVSMGESWGFHYLMDEQ